MSHFELICTVHLNIWVLLLHTHVLFDNVLISYFLSFNSRDKRETEKRKEREMKEEKKNERAKEESKKYR